MYEGLGAAAVRASSEGADVTGAALTAPDAVETDTLAVVGVDGSLQLPTPDQQQALEAEQAA